MTAVVGQAAPDFLLGSTAAGKLGLSQFRGRQHVLVAFFPLAFTSTCTGQLCAFSEDYAAFEAAGTRVLPISVDSVATLKAFKAQERMTIDLLSDFKRETCRAYGVLDEERFHARRSYFLVDREGVLRWSHVEEHNGLHRPDAELLAQIAAL